MPGPWQASQAMPSSATVVSYPTTRPVGPRAGFLLGPVLWQYKQVSFQTVPRLWAQKSAVSGTRKAPLLCTQRPSPRWYRTGRRTYRPSGARCRHSCSQWDPTTRSTRSLTDSGGGNPAD